MNARTKADRGKTARAPLLEQTYARLREMIADGRIRPGERLLEAQVATAFAISRSPAAGALSLLQADRLVTADGRRGFKVAGKAGATAGELATLESAPIAAPRQWERMYDEVERDLLVQLLYGAVRINELQLAQHFGVSRTVTRDLLARMHGLGLIVKDSSGHWIAERFTPAMIRDLYELRVLLEPQALRLAAPHVPPALLAQARAAVTAARAKARLRSAEFDRVERDLHVGVLGYCRNTEILRALQRTHVLFAPTRHLLHPYLQIPAPLIRAALDEHLATIDALIAGDVRAAVATLKAHLEDAVDRWLHRFDATSAVGNLDLPPYLSRVGGPARLTRASTATGSPASSRSRRSRTPARRRG